MPHINLHEHKPQSFHQLFSHQFFSSSLFTLRIALLVNLSFNSFMKFANFTKITAINQRTHIPLYLISFNLNLTHFFHPPKKSFLDFTFLSCLENVMKKKVFIFNHKNHKMNEIAKQRKMKKKKCLRRKEKRKRVKIVCRYHLRVAQHKKIILIQFVRYQIKVARVNYQNIEFVVCFIKN